MARSVAVLLATLLAATWVLSAAASAASKPRKHKHRGYNNDRAYERSYSYRQGRSSNSDYYEHLADKLPFGSQRWWDQMLREGRLGRD
jgi:hypothetical protein